MAYDGSLVFNTKIDEKGINEGFKSVSSEMSGGFSKVGSIAKAGLSIVVSSIAAVSTAMGGAIAAGVKYNAEIQNYATSFEVMTGSAEKAKEVVNDLKKMGAETPFELKDLAETTQLLMNYGQTADQAKKKLKMLGDIAQGNAEKMNGIAMAYGQMSSAGKVSLEDIKQMIERGFNPLQEISESTGESMASLYDRISKGTISVDEITKSMERSTSVGGKYFESMKKQAKTFDGMMSTLKDNSRAFLGELSKNVSEGLTKDIIPTMLGYVDILTSELELRGTEGVVNAVGLILGNALVEITNQAPEVVDSAFQLIDTFVGAINQNAEKIGQNAAGVVSTFANSLIAGLPTVYDAGTKFIVGFTNGISEQAPKSIPDAINTITSLIGVMTQENQDITQAGANLIDGIVQGMLPNRTKIIDTLVDYFATVAGKGGIGAQLEGLLSEVGDRIIGKITDGFKDGMPNFTEIFKELLKGALNISGLTDIYDGAKDAGKFMAEGFRVGYENNIKPLGGLLKLTTKTAIKGVKDFLKIKSPSRLMADEVGRYMALGVGVGYSDSMPMATKEMNKSISKTIGSMQKSVAIDTSIAGTQKVVYANNIEQDTNARTSQLDLKTAVANAFENTKVVLDKREVGRILVVKGA